MTSAIATIPGNGRGKDVDQEADVDVTIVGTPARHQAPLDPPLDPQDKCLEVKKSRQERMFLLKLDIFLMAYGCISCVLVLSAPLSPPAFDSGRIL